MLKQSNHTRNLFIVSSTLFVPFLCLLFRSLPLVVSTTVVFVVLALFVFLSFYFSFHNKAKNLSLFFGTILIIPLLLSVSIGMLYFDDLNCELSNTYNRLIQPFQNNNNLIFGTDYNGKSIFSELLYYSVYTYTICLIAMFVAIFFGTLLGFGYIIKRFRISDICNFIIQTIETLPQLLVLIVVLAVFNYWTMVVKEQVWYINIRNLATIVVIGIAIGFSCIPNIARMIGKRVETLYQMDFVQANLAHGISHWRILWYHILWKNCLADIVISATGLLGFALLVEISLSYLFRIGFGSLGGGNYLSWGQMIADGKRSVLFAENLWVPLVPGLMSLISIIGLNLWGDGLNYWNEKVRKG